MDSATGALLGGYESTRFKSKKSPTASNLAQLELVGPLACPDTGFAAAASRANAVAKGTLLARYLVEAPPNVCTPSHIAEAAAWIAEQHSDCLKLQVRGGGGGGGRVGGCFPHVHTLSTPPKVT